MADYDIVVIGGGPAGYAAALKASALGASVGLIEAEKPGGSCVHHACIPTNIMLDPAIRYVEARELGVMGVFRVGEQFNFRHAAARKDALVRQMADGIRTALRMGKVTLIEGRARFESPRSVSVVSSGGPSSISAESFIIATGTRWDPPVVPGIPPERVVTVDVIQSLAVRRSPSSSSLTGRAMSLSGWSTRPFSRSRHEGECYHSAPPPLAGAGCDGCLRGQGWA